ncbi:MAG: response regulator, partial [Sphingomonadales bacterium]
EIREYLTRKGYICEVAEDGAKALARLKQSELDLLITDIKMPRLDGKDLVRFARELAPKMPIIAITGHGSYRGLKKIDGIDADVALAKPISLRELFSHVQRLLG